jgi:Protein of unknown function (DUF2934)
MATRKVKAQKERQPKASSTGKQVGSANGTAATAVATPNPAPPTFEQIRQRAYLLYLERGAGHGQDWDDWFVAERQLVASRAIAP